MRYPLYVDFDWTLFDPTLPGIHKSTIEALTNLKENYNVDIYLTTGRSATALSEVKDIYNIFKGFILTNSGHIIIDGKTRYLDTIDRDVVKRFASYMDQRSFNYVAVTKDKILACFYQEEVKKRFSKTVKAVITDIKGSNIDYYSDVIQLWPVVENDYLEEINEAFPELDFYFWGSKLGADVVEHGRNKATGIKVVNDLMHYDINKSFAIGDSDNDEPMLRYIPNSICMGKSSISAKRSSKYQTDRIENQGFKKAVDNIIIPLIKEFEKNE